MSGFTKTLESIDLTADPDVETVWVDQNLHEQAMALLLNRLDKTHSLCDTVLQLDASAESDWARRRNRPRIAICEQEGFRKLLPS